MLAKFNWLIKKMIKDKRSIDEVLNEEHNEIKDDVGRWKKEMGW